MVPFIVDPRDMVSAGLIAYDNRTAVAPALKRFRYWFRHGQQKILIYGPGGAGKSTLGTFLAGKYRPGPESARYQNSLKVEDYKFRDEITATMIVAPGQERHRRDSWPTMHRMIVEERIAGLINVVSWGYENPEITAIRPMDVERFFDAHLERKRRDEIAVVEALAHQVGNAKHGLWMLTLVTKQDLWWNQADEVRTHYEHGAYHQHIETIRAALGDRHFRHEYLSVSLVISNLAGWWGEILAQTAAGYDQIAQVENQRNLLQTVTTLLRGHTRFGGV